MDIATETPKPIVKPKQAPNNAFMFFLIFCKVE
jgi:hypothetical protein